MRDSCDNLVQETPGRWQQHATRAFFFIGGFGSASWAPLVPVLKARLGIDNDMLGMLLLCIGVGSLITMPVTGGAVARFGCRRVLSVAAVVYAGMLLSLSRVDSLMLAVPALLVFGSAMGMVDVTANIHAVIVEEASGRQLMSGMHALWSVGGFIGAGLFGIWMKLGFTAIMATVCAAGIMIVLMAFFGRYLLIDSGEKEESSIFAVPRGIVVFIAVIAMIAFLVEGAIMDWSGVFLITARGLDMSLAGTGFAVFSAAMLTMRLTGDWLVQKFGSKPIVFGGCVLSVIGFFFVILTPWQLLLYAGFFLIGIGSANIVPVFFSLLGKQTIMPLNMAVSAVSALGYMGILMGPAIIGFIASQTSLYISFSLLAGLVILQLGIISYVYKKIL
ncbi:MFS transporter [Clostridium saccharobutylicum]|uniref:Inner membrane protein YbjJ n=1 Tax=Clostridium saccharobutylicum TaxID=169679 RepID=A0A1S8NBZ1_CLOSA|nr:MFS transporter [Clostridium saccharobutylicum]OOM13888.1 inner membrane protein YbjJ [Clostridium saccharobutylicum]